MSQIPAPEEIFGPQGLTREDREYRGSRFREVRDALFANPYQQVWRGAGEPPLPLYKVTNRSLWAGSLPFGRPPQFKLASLRTLDSGADLRWGEDGRGFRRLVRPHAVCVTGRWEIDADSPYSGYFRKGSRALAIARISSAITRTLRGPRQSFGLVLKLYPTADPDHAEPLVTANVFLADDLGGATGTRLSGVQLTNAPNVTGFNRGTEIPVLLKEGIVFEWIDRMATVRQVYPVAELGKPADEPTRAPEFLRLRLAPGQEADEDDVRDEVLARIYDPGDPTPRRALTFVVSVSDEGEASGLPLLPRGRRLAIAGWRDLGTLTFTEGVASYNGDFVVHFRHPTWRKNRDDPASAFRQGGRKVRWF